MALDMFDDFLTKRGEDDRGKDRTNIPQQSIKSQPTSSSVESPGCNSLTQLSWSCLVKQKNAIRKPGCQGMQIIDGNGQEFRLIVKTARSVGLHARFQNNWWVVKFTPPKNQNIRIDRTRNNA